MSSKPNPQLPNPVNPPVPQFPDLPGILDSPGADPNGPSIGPDPGGSRPYIPGDPSAPEGPDEGGEERDFPLPPEPEFEPDVVSNEQENVAINDANQPGPDDMSDAGESGNEGEAGGDTGGGDTGGGGADDGGGDRGGDSGGGDA